MKRTFEGWAILDGDALAVYDHRLPLTWLRWTAALDRLKYCNGEGTIRRVTITVEEPTKRRRPSRGRK